MARRRSSPPPQTPQPAPVPAPEPINVATPKAATPRKPRRTAVPAPKPIPGHGSVKSPQSVQRDTRALELRSQGWTYRAISEELGYGGTGNAQRAVEAVVAKVPEESAKVVRAQMVEQLDLMTNTALQVLARTHLAYHQGEPLTDAQGRPVLDDGPTLKAIDTLGRVLERRAKLLGVDAPERSELAVVQLPPEIQSWVDSLKSTNDPDPR